MQSKSLTFGNIFRLHRVFQLTGYEPHELVQSTLYQHVHAADIHHIRYSHQTRKCSHTPSHPRRCVH